MISGDAAQRIYNEVVCRGIEKDSRDTVEEAKYRAGVVEWLRDLKAEGKGPEPIFEFP